MANKTKTELKPCPFCGGEAEIIKTIYGTYPIVCSQDCIRTSRGFFSEADAVEFWNRRVAGERPHGHWITHNAKNPYEIYGECSECGFEQNLSSKLNFCPNCGASMKEEITQYD